MTFTLTPPTGEPMENPGEAALTQALDAVLAGQEYDDDLWLENDAGWALSIVPSGDLFFEQLDDDSCYWTLGPLPRDEILRLMALFARGELETLRAEPWEEAES